MYAPVLPESATDADAVADTAAGSVSLASTVAAVVTDVDAEDPLIELVCAAFALRLKVKRGFADAEAFWALCSLVSRTFSSYNTLSQRSRLYLIRDRCLGVIDIRR
jgi:hypothetical protein